MLECCAIFSSGAKPPKGTQTVWMSAFKLTTAQLQFSHSALKVSCDPSKNDHLAAAHLVANSKVLSRVYTEGLNPKQELNVLIRSQSSISYIRCMHILRGSVKSMTTHTVLCSNLLSHCKGQHSRCHVFCARVLVGRLSWC